MIQYTGCGLDGIFLKNGYSIEQTPYGEALHIDGVEQLHFAIAADIVRQESPMTGHQFRFLRKEQELTQAECAALMRVDVQTIANWEKRGKEEVPGPADFSMRMFYSAYAKLPMSATPSTQGTPNESRDLEYNGSDWIPQPAHAA